MIHLFLNSQPEQAERLLLENNPLSVVSSLVCGHERQYERHCVLGSKGEPIHISSSENDISASCLDRPCQKRGESKTDRSPSLETARPALRLWYCESRDKIGGVLRCGIPVNQGQKDKIISTTTGLNITGRGFLVPDAHGSTSRPGVFASGDVVLGTRTVVEAVKYSKEVARAMDEYLRSIG